MHLRYNIIAMLTCLSMGTAVAQSTDTQLTLDECIAIALSDNPTIKIADMEVTRVDYSKKETLGQLLPTIDFGASYNRMLAKQVMYMNMSEFGSSSSDDDESDDSSSSNSASNGIKMGLDNSYSVGFTASLPLIAPQLWQSLKLSQSQILKNVEQARASRLEMVNQVKSAFYTLLLAEDTQAVMQESYDMAALTYDIYSKKHSAGDASDYDVLRTSVAMKNVEPELLQSEIAIKQARMQLLILMGINADFPLKIQGKLADYEQTMFSDLLNIDTDYKNNSDLIMNDIDTKILKQSIDIKRAAWLPTLALSGNYNWTSSSNGSPFKDFRWNSYSTLGLTLSIPIFNGGQRYHSLKQTEIQYNEMRWQRENLERTVSMQVTLAIENIKLNVKQISSCSESVKEADRAHEIMVKSFAIGAASYLDLRDSELALTRAKLAYYQAIFNYLVARSELELLLGSAPIDNYKTASLN
jgi:outer membrane protein TolC